MTTDYIQAALLSPEEKKVLELVLAAAVSGGTTDSTARAAAAAAQSDLDTTEGTVIADLTALRNAIVYILGALDAQAAVINASGTNAVTTNASGHTPAALTTA